MKTLAIAFSVALVGMAAPVTAQPATVAAPPGEVDTARKLIALLNLDATYDMMFKPLTPIFAQAVIGIMQGDPATRAALQTLFDRGEGGQPRFVAILSEEFSRSIRTRYPELKEAAAVEYAKVFTEAELGDLIAFYSSGTGSKTLQALPMLQQHISVTAQAVGRKAGEEAGRRAFERAEREMLPQNKPSEA